MKKFSYALILGTLLTIVSISAYAQAPKTAPAIRPKVVQSQVLFKKTIWRRMDLNERQNRPFFSTNGEITNVIIEAAKKGLIFPYENDSCLTRLSAATFEERIQIDDQAGGGIDPADTIGTNDPDDPFKDLNAQQGGGGGSAGPQWIPPLEFNVLELKEELFFDRLRSRMYFDIKTVTLYLPSSSPYNYGGFNKQIASFKFSELEKLFREVMPEKSIWYNNQNQAQHRNFADAFTLRLFSAPIVKISNDNDQSIREIYGQGKKGIIAAQKLEHELVDFENQLWEY